MTHRAQQIVTDLFSLYKDDLTRMPDEYAGRAEAGDAAGCARVVADYIAGMTDRFAMAEHRRLTGPNCTAGSVRMLPAANPAAI